MHNKCHKQPWRNRIIPMKSGTIKKKKSVRRTKAAPKTVVRQSYILRKRRLLAMLWNRVNEIEKRVPKSLDEAVELSRQSRRWRKRLARFTKLKTTAFPAYALLVDCWGKSLLLGATAPNQSGMPGINWFAWASWWQVHRRSTRWHLHRGRRAYEADAWTESLFWVRESSWEIGKI